eukprot:scaffold2213_cov143-Isochrysis_galbana.AAC.2
MDRSTSIDLSLRPALRCGPFEVPDAIKVGASRLAVDKSIAVGASDDPGSRLANHSDGERRHTSKPCYLSYLSSGKSGMPRRRRMHCASRRHRRARADHILRLRLLSNGRSPRLRTRPASIGAGELHRAKAQALLLLKPARSRKVGLAVSRLAHARRRVRLREEILCEAFKPGRRRWERPQLSLICAWEIFVASLLSTGGGAELLAARKFSAIHQVEEETECQQADAGMCPSHAVVHAAAMLGGRRDGLLR